MQLTDKRRAAIIGVAQSTFPMLVVLGIVDLNDMQIGAIMLFVSNTITALALAFPEGQGVDTRNSVPIAEAEQAVQEALHTPSPAQRPAPIDARDVEDLLDAYVRKMQAAAGGNRV